MDSPQIISLDYFPLNLELTEPFSIATGAQHQVKNVLVLVRLSNGIEGLGEAAPFEAVSGETQESAMEALKRMRGIVVGRSLDQWKKIAADIKHLQPLQAAARCGVEMAMVDALAKCKGVPLYQYFGNQGNSCETDMTITSGDIEHARTSAIAIAKRGIRTIKIKTAGKKVELDVLRVAAVREAVPDAPILIDGNCGYTLDGAMEFADRVLRKGIRPVFFEQPLPRDDWKGFATLSKMCPIPLAADESSRDLNDVKKIISDTQVNIINIKLMKSGVAEALEMIALARQHNLELMIGGMVESRLAMTFSAHLAAGSGAFKYADLDTPMFIIDHTLSGGFAQSGDLLQLPSAPGIGVGILKMPA